MSRRCISLLVIMGLVASQLAATPHTHAGMSPAEQRRHDASPHVHFGCQGDGAHVAGHQHAQRVAVVSDGQHLADDASLFHHDAHAIFIPVSASSQTSNQTASVAAWHYVALAAATPGLSFAETDPAIRPRWHPPDNVLDGSDIYLTLRQLRN